MGEVERIDKQFSSFDARLRQAEIALERNNILTEKNTEMMEKFAIILDGTRETLCKLSANADESTRINKTLSDSVDKLAKKIDCVDDKLESYKDETDKKIEENENKNKIDTRDVIKSWINKLIIGGGLFSIVYAIIQAVK